MTWILGTITLACLAMAATGQLGRWWSRFDLANDLLPLWLGIGGVAAIAWAISMPSRWPWLTALVLLTAGGDRLLADRSDTRSPEAGVPAGTPLLRIVQFNAWKDNAETDRSARWILAQDADLVFLEEAPPGGALLARLAPHYPYRQTCGAGGLCTTVILSRVRPLDSGGLAQGDPENRGALSAAWLRLPTRCGSIDAIATHMNRPWPWRGADRDLRELVGALDRFGRGRIVLAGDFNRTPWTFGMAGQDVALGLIRATHLLPTWPTEAATGISFLPPILPLDHLYTAASLRTIAVERGPMIGSDHYPLTAILADAGCLQGTSVSR